MTLYVVLGSNGEYSDREVFVCGVFTERNTAQKAVEECLAGHRAYEVWYDTYDKNLRDNHKYSRMYYSDKEKDDAKAIAGPEPEQERAEQCEIVEVPAVNVWMKQ